MSLFRLVLDTPAKAGVCAFCDKPGETFFYPHRLLGPHGSPRLCRECWESALVREKRELADAALERAWQANRKRPEY